MAKLLRGDYSNYRLDENKSSDRTFVPGTLSNSNFFVFWSSFRLKRLFQEPLTQLSITKSWKYNTNRLVICATQLTGGLWLKMLKYFEVMLNIFEFSHVKKIVES